MSPEARVANASGRPAAASARVVPLVVADGDIPSTQLLARVIRAAHGDVEIRYPDTLFGADVDRRHVVISRFCAPTHAWLPGYLEARGIGYLYCLDDHLWAVTDALDAHLAPFYTHPATIAALDGLVRGARAAVVMSKRLGDVIEARLPGTRVEYLNPPFDTERANALLAESPPGPHDDVVRIGYPTSRRPAVAPLLEPVVRHLVQRYAGRVAFEFVGWMPDGLAGVPGVTLFPQIGDYDRYLEFKIGRRWDIGVAPLAGGLFDSCKTSLKYREYGGCRVAGVYGNVPPYTDDVVDAHTGVLVDHDADAWIDALERLIEAPELRARMAAAAHADVEARFSQRSSVRRWREIAEAHANR